MGLLMALVGRRTWVRATLMFGLYLGFGWAAFLPDVEILIRLGGGAIFLFALGSAVSLVCCVRRWRIESGVAHIPVLSDRDRAVPVGDLAQTRLVEAALYRRVVNWKGNPSNKSGQLPINLYVSTYELKRWLEHAKHA